MRHAALLLIAASAMAMSLSADTPYGAQGLAYLADESTLIVRTDVAERLKDPHHEVAAYSVTVSSTINGEAPAKQLLVLAPRGEGLEPPPVARFKNAIAFLYGPIPTDQRASWNVETDTAFLLVSAQYGLVPRSDARVRAITDYLQLGKAENAAPAQQVAWATAALGSKDLFLQESAVLLAGQLLVDAPAAADLLATATVTSGLPIALRRESIELLGSAGTPQAFAALQRIALSPQLSASLKKFVERTFIEQYQANVHRP